MANPRRTRALSNILRPGMKSSTGFSTIITNADPMDGDAYFPIARRRQTWIRPVYALNKPGMIPGDPVIRIPERFRGLV